MLEKYTNAKKAAGKEVLLVFRLGDFYELFYDDAKTAAKSLGLTLTSRGKGKDEVPMTFFPHHQLDASLAKLIKLGHRVAVCEKVDGQ